MYLNCHSYFSFKYGTLSVEKLLAEAQQKNISRLALTDINNTSGVLDFVRLASRYGVTPAVGIDFRNGVQQQFIGIARNNNGFLELNDFLSPHLHAEKKTEKEIAPRAPQFDHAYVIYPFGNIPVNSLRENEFVGVKPGELNKLLFSDLKNYPDKLVALAPVTFNSKKDFNAHRLLRAMDNNTLLSKLAATEQAQPGEMMMSEENLRLLYARFPFLISNAKKILSDCSIHFDFGKSKNKKYFTGNAAADRELLRRECRDGMSYRYGAISKTISDRLEKELMMIEEKDFSAYFLINWDIVRYAQHKNYFYIGRGSGANSLVAYLLRITDVDPIDLDLYFERFINPSRINPPDFDIDFSWKDRDDVTDYIFARHGTRHTALLATYSTLQSNAVVRELGKVFGLPKNEIDSIQERYEKNSRDKYLQLIFNYGNYLHDFPSHLSIHAGGILISEEPIHAYTATNLPPKGFPTTQFSMLEAEDVGLYKFDILSQRGLGHIKDTVEIVKQNRREKIDIHDIKRFKKDERVKERLSQARCMGCFYIESPAMRMLLKKLEVDNYLGLVAASSIIRPGVARSGMMKEYIIRYRNPAKATYVHPLM
ncbi:MAG TPA: DNA polymerase III subunit alpha, partial [Bacteroidetes bacterium]|nr:DNA polymerase III subunit alpha [Bacteroidota bacterium]